MSKVLDFISGSESSAISSSKERDRFDLCYAYPVIDLPDGRDLAIVSTGSRNPRKLCDANELVEDGLYAGSAEPLTKTVVKPYQLNRSEASNVKVKPSSRRLEIAIRDVRIQRSSADSGNRNSTFEITSVALLHRKKIICKSSTPFNRQLYKLLLRDPPDSSNLSIQVHANDGSTGILPLPLPRHSVRNSKLEIDFSITNSAGSVHSGTVICTFSLDVRGNEPTSGNFYLPTNDPNDPRNSGCILHRKPRKKRGEINHFCLGHPALEFPISDAPNRVTATDSRTSEPKEAEDVVIEQTSFSRGQISVKHWFQARHPLRPLSGSGSRKQRGRNREVLAVTILRGVEVPVREESATVEPLLEIEWGEIVHTTTPADGPIPVWHQTFRFEVPEQNDEQSVRLRLYDQHPVWGIRWLGEAQVPMEIHRDYQELERWVGLSPLTSPVASFGYVQPSPGQSYTRLYVLMKMEQPGNPRPPDARSTNALARAIQRSLMVPYKLERVDDPSDASKLAMLLPTLPLRYGPVTPRQALILNKVDHFGRAALLASLLRGLGLQSAVVLGSSQTRKCAAYVVTFDEESGTVIWDPENGDRYKPGESRCSLIRISRLINYQNILENTQENSTAVTFKYEMKSLKNWKTIASRSNETNENRPAQTLEFTNVLRDEPEVDLARNVEQHLKTKISEWRSAESSTTTWNRHAITMLRGYLSKFKDSSKGIQPDKRELKQLFRAYYTHGFVLNLRHTVLQELSEQILSTKIHKVFGPVEFALAAYVERYIGNAHSLWLGILVLRSKE